MPAYFLKVAANVFSPFLAFFIHHVFISGSFPENLKIAKVLPVFKAGSKSVVDNLSSHLDIALLIKASGKIDLKAYSFFFYISTRLSILINTIFVKNFPLH